MTMPVVSLRREWLRTLPQKLDYFSWALKSSLSDGHTSCPCCGNAGGRHIATKLFVTSLLECQRCGLRFRVPRDTAEINERFYQDEYREGISGQLPSEEELAELKLGKPDYTGGGNESRYENYLPVLRSAGVLPPSSILDFGSSWGWGSHQLRQAGYVVAGYEISQPRAEFARERMGLDMLRQPDERRGVFDCVLAAHVLEHVPDPNYLWQVAGMALRPGGTLVVFVPNGNQLCMERHGERRYHSGWGKIHPLMITSAALRYMAAAHGFEAQIASNPYDVDALSKAAGADEGGLELCCVARKA